MKDEPRKKGFSLTEVLIAVGILAVGLTFIAGTFPVGIGLTTVAAERTIGAIVADEAFAKIKLYGVDVSQLNTNSMRSFDEPGIADISLPGDANEVFAYPSVDTGTPHSYYWSALCRRIDSDSRLVQVTVFVCRKTGVHTKYPIIVSDNFVPGYEWPRPVLITRCRVIAGRYHRLRHVFDTRRLVTDNCVIVDDETGHIYRVLTRDEFDIFLDRKWVVGSSLMVDVWVAPPGFVKGGVSPALGGRNPLIGIYQRVIKF
jgi:prepilin-type N-terminal cleavage/methylation domain-containing protein